MNETSKSPEEKLKQKKMQYEMLSAVFLFGGALFSLISFPLLILFTFGLLTDDGTHISENLKWMIGSGVASLVCVSMIRAGWSFYTGKQYPLSVAFSYLGIGFLLLLIALFSVFENDADYSGNQLAAIPFMLILGIAMMKKGGQMLFAVQKETVTLNEMAPEPGATHSVPDPLAQVSELAARLPEPSTMPQKSARVARDKMLLFAAAIALCALCVALIAGLAWLTRDW